MKYTKKEKKKMKMDHLYGKHALELYMGTEKLLRHLLSRIEALEDLQVPSLKPSKPENPFTTEESKDE